MKIQEDSTVRMEVDDVKNSCDNVETVQKKRKKKRKEDKENTVVLKDKINGLSEENGHTENGVDKNTEDSNKRKRKRKLKEISDGSKKEKKKKKLEENGPQKEVEKEMKSPEKSMENGEEKEESSDEKISEKESKMLNGKFLRKSFARPEGLNILRKFLVICKENREKDLAAEYLLSGGSILEILRLLDSTEKKNIANVSTVFSAVHILLMKILDKYPQYQSSAEEACRHLINSHLSSIHTMLSPQSAVKRRKIVLKLLVSIVSLGGSLPREILAHLSLSSQVLESLVKHTKPTDPENVRTCLIHFILAFLVEGNCSVIRGLLEKRALLSSLFPGMIHDSQRNVNLILTSLKTFVLENSGISKTLKLSLFSTPVVQSLVSLYNWKGPKNWPPGKNNSYLNSEEFSSEKETTVSIVHDFLLTLLTSHRHGIVFHDRSLGTSGNRHNQLANTVLLSLDKPWEHEKPGKLVLEILRACPDLVKSQFQLLSPFLEPRLSEKWMKAVQFLREIVTVLEPDSYLKNCSTEMTTWQFFTAIATLTMPSGIVKNYILPSLSHESLTVRQEGISMVSVMLRKFKEFLSSAEIHCHGFIDILSLRNNVNDYVTKNLPSLNEIFGVWEKALSPGKNSEETQSVSENTKQKHLAEILSLLHVYREICPEVLENSRKIQPGILLTGLNDLKNLDDTELNSMKVKAIQLLLVLDPSEFLPQKDTFSKTLSFLINLLDEKSTIISRETMETMKTLLKFSGIFDGCDEQMEIWIHCFLDIPNANDRTEVVDWFLRSIKNAVKNSGKYMKIMSEAEEFPGEKVANSERIKSIFDELSEDAEEVDRRKNNFVKMQKTVSIPIILPSALQELKKNSSTILPRFAAFVLAHTLHCQVSAGPLLRLIEDFEKFPPYFAGWTIGRPTYLKKTVESLSIVCKLSKILIEENRMKPDEIFREKLGKELTDFEILSTLKMAVFYLTQFAQKDIFTEILNDNCKGIIEFLITKAKEKNYGLLENCVKFFFTHPVILQLFSPLRQKKDKTISLITNETILGICRMVSQFNEKSLNEQLFLPFRNKMIDQLKKITKNEQRKSKLNPEIVTEFLELLCFKVDDIVSLLIDLMQLKKQLFLSKDNEKLSIFGHLMPKLLKMLCEKKLRRENEASLELDGKFVRKFSLYLTFFKRDEKLDWTQWEDSFCNYLTTFPHHIADVDSNSFFHLLRREINPSTVKLISILCGSCSRISLGFEKHAVKSEKIMREKLLVFPVIQGNLGHKWSKDFLRKLNDIHQEEILSYLIDPQNRKTWIEENFKAVGFLIENTFDLKTCEKTCATISQIGDKLDLVSWQYVEILENLFDRFSVLSDDGKNSLTIFLRILVHLTTLTLKKESRNTEKLSLLCSKLRKIVRKLRAGKEDFLDEGLADSHSWSQFTRFSLKMGLKKGPKDQGISLLATLKDLCDVAYKDNGANDYVKIMFDMTTSHSEFVNVMLATDKDSGRSSGNSEGVEEDVEGSGRSSGNSTTTSSGSCKRDLVEFLYTLIRKNKSVMNSSHVLLYLSAYNGTLSQSDQFLLLILRFYESNSIRINEYRPYLWGNAAATHYSVKGGTDTALWRQPSTSQVLNLLDQELIENTIRNYPVDRELTGIEDSQLEDIYDPAFYLPILCHLLSDNNVVACHKVMQSGAIALIFVSLASNCKEIRLTAYTALARFYFHLEGTSSKDKLLWMRLVDALRQGIASSGTELGDLRLSGIVSTFLARTSLIVTQPLNPLYWPLQNFLRVKPALEINAVPEFLQLFHSSDVQHLMHRRWILEVIRDGTKTKQDFNVAIRSMIFKMIMDFHSSILADEESKQLIFEVLEATLRIRQACHFLVEKYGLIPWLSETVNRLKNRDSRTLNLIVGIVQTILDGYDAKKVLHDNYKIILLRILLSLKIQELRDRFYVEKYLNVLGKIVEKKILSDSIDFQGISEILQSCKKVLGNVEDCEDLLRHGCQFRRENKKEGPVGALRSLISVWWKNRTS